MSGNAWQRRGGTPKPPRASKTIKEMLKVQVQDDLILTPAVQDFLVSWDGNYPEHVSERIGEVLRTKQRDRSGSWSASSAGKCWRRQELAFLGMPSAGFTEPQMQLIFLNGSWVHLRWQAMLLTAGLVDNVEVLIRSPRQRIRCSMDGMGVASRGRFKGRDFGFELKGRNDWEFNAQFTKGADEETRKQVDFEMMLSGFDLFVIMNENKNTQKTKEWVIARDEGRIKEMRKQVKELNAAIDNQKLHPMLPECTRGEGEWKKCPFGGPGGACQMSGDWP